MADLHCEYLGTGKRPTKRKQCLRIAQPDLPGLQHMSANAEWKALLLDCLKNGSLSRWETWQKLAGLPRKTLLNQLYDWLLRHGWIIGYEAFRNGGWWPYKIEWQHEDLLRKSLGLAIASEQADILQQLLVRIEAMSAEQPDLLLALDSLQAMSLRMAIPRATLLLALQAWREQRRSGTRRDFALEAGRGTKGITEAEWTWLDEQQDLLACGIAQHTPMLLVAAPLVLSLAAGRLDLGAAPDFTALTPATIAAIEHVQGTITTWQLVENRTSFERVARARRQGEGVVWLPGYPPGWWQEAVARLLAWSPAPAQVACDPDPAGITIALAAANIWQQAGLAWEPWRMCPEDLFSLGSRKALLTEWDRKQLDRQMQQTLPAALEALAIAMLAWGEKGEQEGYI